MRYAIFLVTLLGLNLPLLAQSEDSIWFRNSKWETILNAAKEEDKLVFVDAYTDWCAPCKRMDIETFKEPLIISESKKFICFKMNAEKGEGIELAKKYNIVMFPTFLFIRHNGDVVYRVSGYQTPEMFAVHLAKANEQKNTKTAEQWKAEYKEYEAGRLGNSFLYDYIMYLAALDEDTKQLCIKYIETQSDEELKSERNLKLLFENTTLCTEKGFSLLLESRTELFKMYGYLFSNKLNEIVANSRKAAIETGSEEILKATLNGANSVYAPYAESFTSKLQMDFYNSTPNFKAYYAAAKIYLNNYVLPMDVDSLKQRDFKYYERTLKFQNNGVKDTMETRYRDCYKYGEMLAEAAKKIITNSDKTEDFEQAVRWTGKAVSLIETYNTTAAHASALSKLKLNSEAKKYATIAIEKAKLSGNDSKEMDAILKNK